MALSKFGAAAAALAAAGVVVGGGAALANAADNSSSSTSSSSAAAGSNGASSGAAAANQGQAPQGQGGPGMNDASQDTAVTGTEADKVIAAVKAKDATVTIDTVRKDPDGSYDALGTKDGSPVFFDVSADLATITQNTGGPGAMGGHGGGMGGPRGGMDGQAPGGAQGGAQSGSQGNAPTSAPTLPSTASTN